MAVMRVSRSATGRAKAREALARREEVLAGLFTALDKRETIDEAIGWSLSQLEEQGMSKKEMVTLTGLSSREITALLISAPDSPDTVAPDSQISDTGEGDDESPSVDSVESHR